MVGKKIANTRRGFISVQVLIALPVTLALVLLSLQILELCVIRILVEYSSFKAARIAAIVIPEDLSAKESSQVVCRQAVGGKFSIIQKEAVRPLRVVRWPFYSKNIYRDAPSGSGDDAVVAHISLVDMRSKKQANSCVRYAKRSLVTVKNTYIYPMSIPFASLWLGDSYASLSNKARNGDKGSQVILNQLNRGSANARRLLEKSSIRFVVLHSQASLPSESLM